MYAFQHFERRRLIVERLTINHLDFYTDIIRQAAMYERFRH